MRHCALMPSLTHSRRKNRKKRKKRITPARSLDSDKVAPRHNVGLIAPRPPLRFSALLTPIRGFSSIFLRRVLARSQKCLVGGQQSRAAGLRHGALRH